MHLAVNLSVSNLQDAGLPAQVQMLLDAIGVPAEALVLEITENILMADAERSHQVLAGLQSLGCGWPSQADLTRWQCDLARVITSPGR